MHIFAASHRLAIQARRASEWVRGGLASEIQTHLLARRACKIPAFGPYEDVHSKGGQGSRVRVGPLYFLSWPSAVLAPAACRAFILATEASWSSSGEIAPS